MARQRKQRNATASETTTGSKSFRPGCATWSFALLVVLGLLAVFAPRIIARTALLQQILPWALPDFDGQVSIGSASLGWMTAITLYDIAATDEHGVPLLAVKEISSEKTLLALLSQYGRLGHFRIVQPQIHLVLRDDGSNWEDAVAPLLRPKRTAGSPIEFSIAVMDGSAQVRHLTGGEIWQVQQLNASAEIATSGQPITATLAGQIVGTDKQSGQVDAQLTWRLDSSSKSDRFGSGQLISKTDRFPLQILAPLGRRFLAGAVISGSLTSRGQLVWDSDQAAYGCQIDDFVVHGLQLGAPQWTGGERLEMDLLTARGQVALEGNKILADDFRVASDLLKLEATGKLETSDRSLWRAGLQEQDFRVSGEVDVARFARMLPQTLRIREGTQLTSGQLTATLYSRLENGNRCWSGTLETANLAATIEGGVIRWDQPTRLTFSASHSPQGPIIDQLACESSFLNVTGRGTLTKGAVSASGDLGRLAAELGQFFDLRQWQLAGKLAADVNWQPEAGQQIVAHGQAAVESFQLVAPGGRPWREKRLTIALDASGSADSHGLNRIDRASTRMQSGEDMLHFELTEPITQLSSQMTIPARCQMAGELATWLPRIQIFLPLPGWQVKGIISLDATGTATANAWEIATANAAIKGLQAHGAGLHIQESEVRGEIAAAWDGTKRMLRFKTSTMASSSLSLRTDNLRVDLSDGNPRIHGNVAFRGDLARLMAWTYESRSPPTTHLFGMLVGQANVSHNAGVTLFDWSGDIDKFSIASRDPKAASSNVVVSVSNPSDWQSVWHEKRVKLKGHGDYSHASAELRLAAVDVSTDAFRVAAQGKINELDSRYRVDLDGALDYDLSVIAQRLRPLVSHDLQLVGRGDSRRFFVRGPLLSSRLTEAAGTLTKEQKDAFKGTLVPRELSAEATVAWSSASARGFSVGQGELEGKLAGGVLQFSPLDLSVNQGGRIKFEPRVLLNEDPAVLVLERGSTLENVHISPEMFHTWLKYVAPLLADATRAEGRLSADLADVAIPVSNPSIGTVRGQLHIHQAQVGPGPLGQELLTIADQVLSITNPASTGGLLRGASQRWITLPQQSVDVQMTAGRVHHKGLQLVIGTTPIRTQGSVGFDQSLSLVAEVSLGQQSDVARLLPGLSGQTLQVPIRGSLSKPQVDHRVVSDLTRQFIGGSVEKLFQEELIKGFEGLFGPRK